MQLKAYPPEIINEFINRLRSGASIKMACDSTGLARSDYYEWTKRAKSGDLSQTDCREFAEKARKAQADFRWSLVKEIKATDPKQWQARAWLLERSEPEVYSEKFRLKKYPEYLIGKPYVEQGNEIFKLLINGDISLQEAHLFVETLAKLAGVEEIHRLKEELFEIKERIR